MLGMAVATMVASMDDMHAAITRAASTSGRCVVARGGAASSGAAWSIVRRPYRAILGVAPLTQVLRAPPDPFARCPERPGVGVPRSPARAYPQSLRTRARRPDPHAERRRPPRTFVANPTLPA